MDFLRELYPDVSRRLLYIRPSFVVLGGILQVLEHERGVRRKLCELREVRTIIHLPFARHDLQKVHVELRNPLQILRMARRNPPSQLLNALADQVSTRVKPPRRIDHVAAAEVTA